MHYTGDYTVFIKWILTLQKVEAVSADEADAEREEKGEAEGRTQTAKSGRDEEETGIRADEGIW